MRTMTLVSSAALLLIAASVGCAKHETPEATTASSDSLLSSNPVEQPSGSITPQSEYAQPQPEPEPPASTPTRSSTPKPRTRSESPRASSSPAPRETGVKVDAGTPIEVSVSTQVSSETANAGDTWTGEVKDNVIVGDRVVFPAGSLVTGVVTEATPAKKGTRANLGLAVTAITVNGTKHAVDAGTENIEAGSTRARNLGAIAGSAAAGALIGKAVGGSGKGALIGGLVGGAAAGAGVAASKGYQVRIKEGTVITFSVKAPVTVRT